MYTSILGRLFLSDDVPSPSKGIYLFFEFIALGFALEAVADIVHYHGPWYEWMGSFTLAAIFLALGVNWPSLQERVSRFKFLAPILVLVVGFAGLGAIVLGGLVTYRRFYPKPVAHQRPAAPTLIRADARSGFEDVEKPISISQLSSPCTPKGSRILPPNSIDPRKPLLAVTLERWVQRATSDPVNYEILIEASVTSRGEASIAKDWRLCLVNDNQASHYRPEEIVPSNLASFQNTTILEEAAVRAPIKRGEAVVGWLLFKVPRAMSGAGHPLLGGLDYRDYLGRSFSAPIGLPESAGKK